MNLHFMKLSMEFVVMILNLDNGGIQEIKVNVEVPEFECQDL
jgi:hypothetical protein